MTQDSQSLDKLFYNIMATPMVDWDLFNIVTTAFRCIVIIGAGNHFSHTPTMGAIAQSEFESDRFRIIRPNFDYELVHDTFFERLLQKSGHPFYYQVFKNDTDEMVVLNTGFPNKYKVKRSFAGAFGSALRLDYKNVTASRAANLRDEPLSDCYRDLLVSLNKDSQMLFHYDFDFDYKFPKLELRGNFPNHLKNNFPSTFIIHPLEYFYQSFDRPSVSWLNLNQDGILERNVTKARSVNYHGNVELSESELIWPGHTGPINKLAEQRTLSFLHQAQVVISLGYSFSDYDYDILQMLGETKKRRFIIFDLNSEKICNHLRSYFTKAIIMQRSAFLPLIPKLNPHTKYSMVF